MPGIYLFQHPKTKKVIEVVQPMNDEHTYTDDKGIKWDRLFTSPNAQVKDNLDPHNPNDYLNKTKNSKGSIGDLMDLSGEMSEKRKKNSKDGTDPQQNRFFDAYSKKRCGKKHPEDKR